MQQHLPASFALPQTWQVPAGVQVSNIFVAKLDSGGKFVWAVSVGGTFRDDGKSIAVDGSGNSYM